MYHEVCNTCSLWLARCSLATEINVSEGHVHTTQTAPTISLQYQTPLLSPLKTRYIVLYGHPHRYVSLPGTLQGFLEIGVASMGENFTTTTQQLCRMHASQ